MKGRVKIAIVDYHMSNLYSVKNACDHMGVDGKIASSSDEIMYADGVILPGVGAFGDAMKNLKKLDLISPIRDFVLSGRPFMGICLGLQLLFSGSEEFGETEGLSLIPGKVVKFYSTEKTKVPHVGWNGIYPPLDYKEKWKKSPLRLVEENGYMYFVHSFYVVPENKEDILSLTSYGADEFCSSVLRDNIFATQFHPEKSATEGMKIYSEWIRKIKKERGE